MTNFIIENDVLEFDYKHDMIFPDYETPVKDRSELLGSSLEDDEDSYMLKSGGQQNYYSEADTSSFSRKLRKVFNE